MQRDRLRSGKLGDFLRFGVPQAAGGPTPTGERGILRQSNLATWLNSLIPLRMVQDHSFHIPGGKHCHFRPRRRCSKMLRLSGQLQVDTALNYLLDNRIDRTRM